MIDLKVVARWVAGILLVLVVLALYNGHQRSLGALEAKIASLEAQTKVLSHEADSLEGVFRIDTVRLTKAVRQTDTVLHTLIDSAIVHHTDTLTITKEVLIQADSTIKACTLVLSDCEKGWTAEKALNATLRDELSATKAKTPSWLSERFGVGAGYSCIIAGQARCGPAVGAIIRIWP